MGNVSGSTFYMFLGVLVIYLIGVFYFYCSIDRKHGHKC